MKYHICPFCESKRYNSLRAYNRHKETCFKNPYAVKYECPDCHKKFMRRDTLALHRDQHKNWTDLRKPMKVDDELLRNYDAGVVPFEELVEIRKSGEICADSAKLMAKECIFKVDFTKKAFQLAHAGRLYKLMQQLFEHIAIITKFRRDDVLVQVVVESKSMAYPLASGGHIGSEFNLSLLFDRFDHVSQSTRLFQYDEEDPELSITVFQMPLPTYGAGDHKTVHKALIDPQIVVDELKQRNVITNCLIVSICLSITKVVRSVLRRLTYNFLQLVTKFPQKSRVTQLDFKDIAELVHRIFDRQLIIINQSGTPIFISKFNKKDKLFVVSIENHMLACPNIALYLGSKRVCHCGNIKRGLYFCYDKQCRSNTRLCARCNSKCTSEDTSLIYCPDCLLTYKGNICFENHIRSKCYNCVGCSCVRCRSHGKTVRKCVNCKHEFKTVTCYENHLKSVCESKIKCSDCGRIISREYRDNHNCKLSYCKLCSDYFPWDHVCYIQPTTIKQSETKQKYIIFDFETIVEPVSSRIIPILVYGVKVCEDCIDDFENTTCCTEREFTFDGRDCLSLTVDYIMKQDDCLVLSFCGSKFDNVLLFENMIKRDIKCQVLLRGQNLLILKTKNSIICKDIYLFLPSSLHSCAEQFGLSQHKSFYPLKRLNFDTLNKCILVNREDFGYSKMHGSRKWEFEKFYKNYASRGKFNMKSNLITYCKTDVMVTWELVSCYRKVLMSTFGKTIEPFVHSNGLPSLCALIFKTNFMEKDTIQRIGDKNCIKIVQESRIAAKYMWTLSQKIPNLQTQVRLVGRITVDGLDSDTNTAYFFDGCYYHACKCQKKHGNARHPTRTFTYREIQEYDYERNRAVVNAGYNIVIVKECQINAELRQNQEMKYWFDLYEKNHPFQSDYLRPREGVYGGRTGCCSLLVELVNTDYKLKYLDVVSLYPYIQSKFPLPLGKFKRFRGDQICPDLYKRKALDFGLYYCVLEADAGEFFPTIPIRIHERLVFANCTSCAKEADHNKVTCSHSPQERYLTGVYTSAELNMFLATGKIVHIYEYWAFESSTTLYTDYIRTIATAKIESSGWPESCTTERDQMDYVERLKNDNGITINPANVRVNKALRAVMKTLMNATWGKHCENPSSDTKIIDNSAKIIDYFKKGNLESMKILPGNKVMVKVKTDKPTAFNNLVLGAFVTSWARLELLKYLRQAGPNTVYHDTDSIIYLQKSDAPELIPSPKTPVLGELKDEYPHRRLTRFCSIGSKSYAIADDNVWQDVKFKGIQGGVSYEMMRGMLTGSAEVDYDDGDAVIKIREMLQEGPREGGHTKVPDGGLQRCIYKPVNDGFIKQRDSEKIVKLNFTNRRIVTPKSLGLPDVVKISSVPWGYAVKASKQ